jgi:5'-methylthioadenosine phosphorylase
VKREKLKTPVTALIGGTSLMNSQLFSSLKAEQIKTAYGVVLFNTKGAFIFLQRHGKASVPPHMINHRANIQAMKDLGAVNIIAFNSVGSLKTVLKPGTFIIPDDFISLSQIPTFFDNDMKFIVPEMDRRFGKLLYGICKEHIAHPLFGGTYIQTPGPRLETKAEIRMFKDYGHIIGMTMASEATLCMEYGIPYASLCSIDNYCNGITRTRLTMQEINNSVAKNIKIIEGIIEMLITGGIP